MRFQILVIYPQIVHTTMMACEKSKTLGNSLQASVKCYHDFKWTENPQKIRVVFLREWQCPFSFLKTTLKAQS